MMHTPHRRSHTLLFASVLAGLAGLGGGGSAHAPVLAPLVPLFNAPARAFHRIATGIPPCAYGKHPRRERARRFNRLSHGRSLRRRHARAGR